MWKRRVEFCLAETMELSSSDTSSSSSASLNDSSSVLSDDSWIDCQDHTNDVLWFPLMQSLTCGYRRQRVTNYLAVVEIWTDLEFKEHLRLQRPTVYQLIDEFEKSPFLAHHTFGMKPITAKLSILIFLWFIANTEPLRTIADRFDISISSAFRVIRRVVAWISTKSNDIIQWPQNENIVRTCDGFSSKQGIKKIIGSIDCTHIRIMKPAVNSQQYCNRKKFFSIVLQAVVDPNMRFTNLYCGEPGSMHDARILRRSPLFMIANNDRESLFPNQTYIIGDSAYPSLPWLVPPFRDNGHLTAQQTEFNYMHSSTRIAVERAFGVLKGRFRRIKFFSEYRNIKFITDVVIAACILHNYCINENDSFDINEDDIDIHANDDDHEIVQNAFGVDRRMELFRDLFPNV